MGAAVLFHDGECVFGAPSSAFEVLDLCPQEWNAVFGRRTRRIIGDKFEPCWIRAESMFKSECARGLEGRA
jgi:hypothetical protein